MWKTKALARSTNRSSDVATIQRVSGHEMQAKAMNSTEEKRFLGDHKNIRDFRSSSSSSSSTTSTKVKIS
uniref:Uncharacterized protein n=1 Tax=Salix viminalis TaxID=40686 RepID=A0A6N2MRP0_SALVM